jgi:carboxylesterase type B
MGNTLSAYEESECHVELGKQGCLKGTQFSSKSRRYCGIPYALPPTGDYRWKKPRPLPKDYTYLSSEGAAFDCTKFRAICPQPTKYTSAVKHLPTTNVYDEDCLFLNIWAPYEEPEPELGQAKTKWPVMLWLHGGWFQMGDPSHEPGMDPTEMISTGKLNAIVVAIGYRLNLFGFLAGDALTEEGAGQSGNYGLWDQRLAIEWVRENISAFHGDPQNITLAGRSAGAYSVQAQTLYDFQSRASGQTSPFQRIAMISNAIPTQPKTMAESQDQFNELCQHFAISASLSHGEKLSMLRALDANTLMGAIMKLKHHTFRPVTDLEFIQPGIIEYHRSGAFAAEFKKRGFRLLIGEVGNEETLYAVTNGPEANLESLRVQVGNYYSSTTSERVLEHYELPPCSAEKSEWATLYGNIIADGQVRAPSRFLANSLWEHGVAMRDIWRYRIAYRLSFITEQIAPASFGVAHAMDKPFWK